MIYWYTCIIISEDDNYLFLSGRKCNHVGGYMYESRWQTQSSSCQKTKKWGDYVILKKKMIGENQRRIKHRSLWGWNYQFRRTSKSGAVLPPALYVRELEMHQTKSIFSSQNNLAKISLTNQCKEEIFWWTLSIGTVEWEANSDTRPISSDRNRCISAAVGMS